MTFQIKLWQNENQLDQCEFNKVLLYEKLSSKNTLFEGVHFDRSGLPLQRVHCFQREFFSGGTSKEVSPLERGDSPRMSRRLRPDYGVPTGKNGVAKMASLRLQIGAQITRKYAHNLLIDLYLLNFYGKQH